MATRIPLAIAAVAVIIGSAYQFFLRDFLYGVIGVGRVIQPIEDFPYICRRVHHEKLHACEDLWLDSDGRKLYLACTSLEYRQEWNTGMLNLNATSRPSSATHVSVLNIDEPGSDGLFGVHTLDPGDYRGTVGDGSLDILGFDAEVVDADTIRFYFVNNAPPVDSNNQFVDPYATGIHSTIQIFDHKRGSSQMKFQKLIESSELISPNRAISTRDGGILITNDHSNRATLPRTLEIVTGGGNILYCDVDTAACHVAADKGFSMPNGLAKGTDGLYYVPLTTHTQLQVFSLGNDKKLKLVNTIEVGMPIDNLSVDENGDILAAGFPDFGGLLDASTDPWNKSAPGTVLRIRKPANQANYTVEKVVEDRDAKAVASITTAAHDAKTGRLFMSGVISPFITICDPK